MARSKPPRSRLEAGWWGPLVIVLAGLAVYAPSFDVPFLFDDQEAILDNPTIRHWRTALRPPDNGTAVQNRPVVNLSLAANFALGGFRVGGYHAVNLAIHLLAACVLWGLVRRTLALNGMPAHLRHAAPAIALAVALIWVLHPLATEAVTYVIQRTESLVGLWYLATLYGVVRAGTSVQRGWMWQVAAVAACLLGMGTKEVMATAPLAALAYDRVFLARSWRQVWRDHGWMHLGLAASWGLLAALVLPGGTRGEAAGFGLAVTPWQYAATQAGVIAHYLRLCFWPHPLVLDYGMKIAQGAAEIVPYAALIVLLLGATGWALWRHPRCGFLGLCFFLVLAPSSSVVPLVSQTAAEKRMYLPLAAVVTLVVLACLELGRRRLAQRPDSTEAQWIRRGWLPWAALVLVCVALGALTWRRNQTYRSPIAIWTDTVLQRPDNVRAYNGLGAALLEARRYDEAAAAFRQAIELNPEYAAAYSNLGLVYAAQHRYAEAEEVYAAALRANPSYHAARTNLGLMLAAQGKASEAAVAYKTVLESQPDDPAALLNLAELRLVQGQVDEAAARLEAALRADPELARARFLLGAARLKQGRSAEAAECFQAALAASPDWPDAHANLGLALAALGRREEAVDHYRRALAINPRLASAHLNLANLLQSTHPQEAITHYAAATQLHPGQAEAHNNLAVLLARAGRRDEAVEHYRQALAIDPNYAHAHLNLADLLVDQQRLEEAVRHYEAVLRIQRDAPGVAERVEQLRARLRGGAP